MTSTKKEGITEKMISENKKVEVNIENEIEYDFGFDCNEVIVNAVNEAAKYMKLSHEAEVNVLITGNEEIHLINKEYRNIDAPTDVLSFPMIEYEIPGDFSCIRKEDVDLFNPLNNKLMLGDIVLSKDKILSQAAEYGHSVIREMSFLVVHSMLHLFGFDHIDENDKCMEQYQEKILNDMGILR